jgi:short-subunit dehydrogenase
VALPPPSESSTALITGASSGIGEAIARELASRGHGVTLVARREDRLRGLAGELHERDGVRTEAIGVDLGDAGARDALSSRLEELGLDVEILVNNAGFGGAENFVDSERGRLVGMVRLNCEALLDLQARYLPDMVKRGRGAVINVASTASFQPLPRTATYAATKAFVLSLSEAVHEELRDSGVTLTALCPGPVRTEFMEQAPGLEESEEKVPDVFWMSAAGVAKDAVDGAERGKRVVVPGLMNRAGALAGQHAPRMLALRVAGRAWRAL